MISASSRGAYATALAAVRRLSLGLLLLAVPACGLSDYEKLMRNAQERKERFDEEELYLGEPVKMPKEKDKDDHEKSVANVFFRPPKGIDVKPQEQPRGGLKIWRYARGKNNSDFHYVEMAFAEDSKDFANNVVGNYATGDQTVHSNRSIQAPEREQRLLFEAWDSKSDQSGYSINVLMGSKKPLAIIYHYKAGSKTARKAIELSLESVAVDKDANAAREVYSRRSPWRLDTQPSEESESN